ncbi:MAG: cytochrome d ubiquinol oxidase subunit II [Desulfovibrio sp.]|jgi:cytochrome d ubiquinol oxidase subunit II|nr:cytochrome d ubiquinol oxidase subunit II [Desulfovibrio sp.]
MTDILSHECLQIIWFLLWGLLWAIYFILDGFDLGMGTLLPFLTGTEDERRTVYNAAGPYWDGNEVWLITAGGVTFAAFPTAYAVLFSALYAPLLILLFALILRAVSFEFRNKIDDPRWRKLWDTFQFLGNFVPALLLGVAFAGLFQGIPINENGVYTGNLLTLLNVYGLLGGIFFVVMFAVHGALWLNLKSEGILRARAEACAQKLWFPLAGIAVAFLVATAFYTPLYAVYLQTPILGVIPLLAVILLFALRVLLGGGMHKSAFAASAGFMLCVTLFGVIGMFPNIVLSSLKPEYSVTIAEAASSQLTLTIMLCVALICVPVVIIYQSWVYKLFSVRVTKKELDSEYSY